MRECSLLLSWVVFIYGDYSGTNDCVLTVIGMGYIIYSNAKSDYQCILLTYAIPVLNVGAMVVWYRVFNGIFLFYFAFCSFICLTCLFM